MHWILGTMRFALSLYFSHVTPCAVWNFNACYHFSYGKRSIKMWILISHFDKLFQIIKSQDFFTQQRFKFGITLKYLILRYLHSIPQSEFRFIRPHESSSCTHTHIYINVSGKSARSTSPSTLFHWCVNCIQTQHERWDVKNIPPDVSALYPRMYVHQILSSRFNSYYYRWQKKFQIEWFREVFHEVYDFSFSS